MIEDEKELEEKWLKIKDMNIRQVASMPMQDWRAVEFFYYLVKKVEQLEKRSLKNVRKK